MAMVALITDITWLSYAGGGSADTLPERVLVTKGVK